MIYFIGLYTAHLCGDVLAYFPVLSRAKRENRNNQKILAIAIHCLIHSLFVLLWFRILKLDRVTYAMVYIFIIHFIIDLSRIYYEGLIIGSGKVLILKWEELVRWLIKKEEEGHVGRFMEKNFVKWMVVNVLDQGMHFLSIAVIAYIIV